MSDGIAIALTSAIVFLGFAAAGGVILLEKIEKHLRRIADRDR